MSGRYMWKGRTTGKIYQYDRSAIPAVLIDVNGNPVDGATYNGEILVIANEDGSVAMSVAAGPPPGAADIWSGYVHTSTWESNPPP